MFARNESLPSPIPHLAIRCRAFSHPCTRRTAQSSSLRTACVPRVPALAALTIFWSFGWVVANLHITCVDRVGVLNA